MISECYNSTAFGYFCPSTPAMIDSLWVFSRYLTSHQQLRRNIKKHQNHHRVQKTWSITNIICAQQSNWSPIVTIEVSSQVQSFCTRNSICTEARGCFITSLLSRFCGSEICVAIRWNTVASSMRIFGQCKHRMECAVSISLRIFKCLPTELSRTTWTIRLSQRQERSIHAKQLVYQTRQYHSGWSLPWLVILIVYLGEYQHCPNFRLTLSNERASQNLTSQSAFQVSVDKLSRQRKGPFSGSFSISRQKRKKEKERRIN